MRNRKIQRQLRKQGIHKQVITEKPWKNAEGYDDPTAYAAICHVDREIEAERRKAILSAVPD